MKHRVLIHSGSPYEQAVINTVCQFKQLPAETQTPPNCAPLQLHINDFSVSNLLPSIIYLDAKFPAPTLLPGPPEAIATFLTIATSVANCAHTAKSDRHVTDLLHCIPEADPFILGAHPSILDAMLMPLSHLLPTSAYKDTLTELANSWHKSSSSPAWDF